MIHFNNYLYLDKFWKITNVSLFLLDAFEVSDFLDKTCEVSDFLDT
jgi:hypothetical protein